MDKDEALDLALEALEGLQIYPETSEYFNRSQAITAIKQARSAPVQPVAFNAGVPPLYPEMKDGETISVEYTTPPAAQQDIQRLSALVRAQQITIDKLEQALAAPMQETVAHCEAGPEHCQQCYLEGKNT